MANIKSSKKRIKVIENKTAVNRKIKNRLKGIIKDFETAVEEGDKDVARERLAMAEKRIMQAAAKGIMHKNTAARRISKLTKEFSKAFGLEALSEKPKAADKAKKSAPAKKAAPKKEAKTEEKADEKVEEAKSEESEAKADDKTEETPKKTRKKTTKDTDTSKDEEPKA